MSQQFRIPKQTDLSIVLGLSEIRNELKDFLKLTISVVPHYGVSAVNLPDEEPQKSQTISFVLSENSQVVPDFFLVVSKGHRAFSITRCPNDITDQVTIHWDVFVNFVADAQRSASFVKLMAISRKHLRAIDVEANLDGTADTAWTRYRDSQQAVLNSLQETQKSILVEFNRKSLEAEEAAKTRREALEAELQKNYQALQTKLADEHKARMEALDQRESALTKLRESFNTKEARYVARQQQQAQIDQIKGWLEGWSLTKGTTTKRMTVAAAYGFAIIVTGVFTVWFSGGVVEILKSKDLAQIAWWQWMLLSLKSILPFAAFTTFIVYFIRWSSAWARQHAEEEFRNRARVLDIGRTSWLLEAVRDAQDNQKELPADLMKELSRNLFSYGPLSDGSDLHPQAVSDLLMQGLASIRVKSADGSEVEATRGKKPR